VSDTKKPIPKWQKGCLGVVFGFLALIILIISFAPDPEDVAETEPSASQTKVDAITPDKNSSAKADILVFWRSMAGNIQPCDQANTAAINALRNVSETGVYGAYEIATTAVDRCSDTWLGFSKLKIPKSVSSEEHSQIEGAIDTCKTGYYSRKGSLETLQKALDGDMRPSVVQSFKSDSQFAQNAAISCIATVMSIAVANGLNEKDLALD